MSASTHSRGASSACFGMLLSGGLIVLILGTTAVTAVAGDLLRGGYTGNPSRSANPASLTPPSVSQARANMVDQLARATEAAQAARQMQSAARSIAASAGKNNLGINPNDPSRQLPNVPNGLGAGGLNPATGAAWTGAGQPTEATSNGRTVVTVKQTSPDATLTWTTFNIGGATALDFNQSKTGANPRDSIVFNIIEDPSGAPSQILGSIQAPGQVYVINQNGIIFGGASQVNVHTLVASSLPIDSNLVSRGLLNNPDLQFLFTQVAIPAGTNGPTPAFTPPQPVNGTDGAVTVQAGAQITAPENSDNTGGRVVLIGPNVTNAGTITTPDGQTILAAGNQVGFVASTDATLRGLVPYIGAVDASSGDATNTGILEVPRGDATIAGKSVNQLGVIDSTTSVSLNGRVDLDAAYGSEVVPGQNNTDLYAPTASGKVTIGPGSATEILPELSSAETVVGTTLALPSKINIEGETIHFATDSQILAPNANVTVSAGGWYQQSGSPAHLIPDSGQIYFDAGATIDVAGSIVSAPVSQNIVSAELLGPELADSPLQRNGVLYGQTVEVDARATGIYNGMEWVGTPLANVSGYIGLIQLPVGELTTGGGTVSLSAGGSVVMQPASEINVSGGAINYQGGMVRTTDLISGGHIINIADATPDLVYQGILGRFTVDSAKWGIEETFTTPLVGGATYQASYTEGGNGGSITISAPSVALDGQLLGRTSPGPRQLQIPPARSSLTLSFQMDTSSGSIVSPPTPPHVVFEPGVDQSAVPAFAVDASGDPLALPAARQAEVILSPGLLTQDGFGSLTVNDGDGNITVPSGVALTAPAWGSITLNAANLDIEGSVTAPDGTLDFTVYDYSPYAWLNSSVTTPPPANPSRGHFVLGASASLSTAGLIVDDRLGSTEADTAPLATSGGTIAITSFSADLAAGSTIDVSGGLAVSPASHVAYGNGGAVSISAGQDPNSKATLGGNLTLDATLMGYSGSKGGSLSILAPAIQIGGGAPADADTLVLAPAFFSQGGFTSFSLTGLGNATANSATPFNFLPAILITPGTVIAPVAENWLAAIHLADGVTLTPVLLPEAQRTPVSLSLSAAGVNFQDNLVIRGDFVMGSGAAITTDPLGSVSINANAATVLGSIIAPGGTISIKGAGDSNQLFASVSTAPLATVYLGPNAVLSTAGTTVLTPDIYGNPSGTVLPGGAITISGNIVAAAGSTLNVSGASGVLYLPQSETTLSAQVAGSFLGAPIVPFRVDSNGGWITLSGGQELFTDATLIGAAGGPAAVGGRLTVSSGLYQNQDGTIPVGPTSPTLVVTQSGPTIPAPAGIGEAVLGSNGQVLSPFGEGHIAVDSFLGGGFDNITMAGNVQFNGKVAITAGGALSVGNGGVIVADGAVSLSAPYVALGMAFEAPLTPNEQGISPFGAGATIDPTFGTGSLTVTADLIDIGNLSLEDIGRANFIAANGDIRGDGTLDIQGHITLTAGQIYPATETTFAIAAYDYNGSVVVPGSVTIKAAGSRDLPLSAGGTLDVYASIINQDGVLRAPIGTINLGWNGAVGKAPINPTTGGVVDPTTTLTLGSRSITSVSAVDPQTGQALIIPYGSNPTGTEWIDPAGNNITAGGVPEKAINIAGAHILDQAGSVIDFRGGGDLSSYEFVAGQGGSTDFLSPGAAWKHGQSYSAGQLVSYKGVTWVALEQTSSQAPAVNQYWSQVPASYAVIPGYQAGFAPYAPFNAAVGDPGYVSAGLQVGEQVSLGAGLQVGEQVRLGAGSGLAAGIYTLLPSRYALLPGAFLVTPDTGAPVIGQTLPDGSNLVSGYLFNGLSNPGGLSGALVSRFEVDSQAVVLSRGQYDTFLASSFLARSAAQNKSTIPLLPVDAGQLNFNAGSELVLRGIVEAQAPAGGSAGFVNIDSSADIFITAGPSGGSVPGLALNASELSLFGAANLLIGGYATTGADGTTLTVDTAGVTVEQGATLSGGDIILAANNAVTLDQGASVTAKGFADDLALSLTGNGALLRVSNDPSARIVRTSVTPAGAGAALTVGAGVSLRGASVILDSSQTSKLDSSAKLDAKSVTIDSGLISIVEANGASGATPSGLVLSGNALQQIQSHASALALLSYSSIDIYGTGAIGTSGAGSLTLTADEIRGFDQAGGSATFNAQTVTLNGEASTPETSQAADGTLVFKGTVIRLGGSGLAIDPNVELIGSGGIIAVGSGIADTASSLVVGGNLTLTSPLITGAAAARADISSGGQVAIAGAASKAEVTGGLGANISITGAGVEDNGNISAPGGELSLVAASGDVMVGNLAATSLNAEGTAQVLLDQTKYTSGGTITLTSDQGSVDVAKDATLNVAAQAAGGNAGTLSIKTPRGSVRLMGTLLGQGGAGGENGAFSLDAGSIPGGSLKSIDGILAAGGFTRSVSIRDRTDSLITVDGVVTARTFDLSLDSGSINVSGMINASGLTGGTIDLIASGSVILENGAELTVAGQIFNAAGQGGSVTIEAGAYTGGNFTNVALGTGPQVNIEAGSTIDLSVAANAAPGDFSGKLLVSAPQALGNTDVQVQPIDGTIKNASSIVVEGLEVFDATDGSIDNQEANVLANGNTFAGAAGAPASASFTAMADRLFANNMSLITATPGNPAVAVIEPGAEIVNPGGALTLANDWDLSTFRFGPDSAPGVLTLRASGNLVFDGALSDGFNASPGTLWEATLLTQNTLLPVNAQDWSYNLTAGADFTGANAADVLPVSSLGGSGSLELGINDPDPVASNPGPAATTASVVAGFYQVIRTGAGNIDISAGANVELLNQFATIYTAGVQVLDATLGGTFSVPVLDESRNPAGIGGGSLFNPGYQAQYSEAGGNVTISAQQDIEHLTQDSNGNLVMDSQSELPGNWLYRRGAVASSGLFDSNSKIKFGGDPSESTTWWIDFSNFFEGVGALGGGNVRMIAGGNIANVDAVIPTNARMPGINPSGGNLAPDAGSLVQLGGGNLLVQAGNDINGGVYYVENGRGALIAGGQILTNSTRSPVGGESAATGASAAPSQAWLPTTLFAGNASFDITAGGNVLLGPVANPFLLPEGLDNSVWYKTYFSTYGMGDTIDVTSLGGSITFREYANVSDTSGPILQVWLQNMGLLFDNISTPRSYYQPWLRLNEESVVPFSTVANLMPPTLLAAAFSGDINIAGSLLLSPSPAGTIDLAASGSINGFQSLGTLVPTTTWLSATIDLSDSNPASIPGIASPLGYQEVPGVGTIAAQAGKTNIASNFLGVFDDLFDATNTGTPGVLETEEKLHDQEILHAGNSTPVELYAANGNVADIELFSPTETRVIAGADITDIALYLQNDNANAISVVSAGGEIVLYDPTSPARQPALRADNIIANGALPGDIQIAGPGTLEVLAGGSLELGGQGPGGPTNTTGNGIASVGNTLNPALPFAGADIIAAAGIGSSAGLGQSELDFAAFISQFIESPGGATYLGELSQITSSFPAGLDARSFSRLTQAEKDLLALDVFFLVLRDAGRDHNDPASAGYGNYDAGLAAIAALFPKAGPGGDIDVTSRDIKTESGGNISLLAPKGQVTVGLNSSAGDDVTNLGIVTQDGGNISVFASGDVNVGTSRIFTLRGGNEIIWSTGGNIDAGASSKTVQSAPPTRVLVNPQSANVQTDLAGLATGGGIGVLATVTGISPGNVDLIAPAGVVNAGEAGIRATGNLNIAAVQVLNAGNIAVSGASTGLPPPVAGPNIASLAAASSAAGSAIGASGDVPQPQNNAPSAGSDVAAIITVQVLYYGGGDGDDTPE